MTAITLVFRVRNRLAARFKLKLCCFARAWRLSRVSCLISGLLLSALDTVEVDTPASLAKPARVILLSLFKGETSQYILKTCQRIITYTASNATESEIKMQTFA